MKINSFFRYVEKSFKTSRIKILGLTLKSPWMGFFSNLSGKQAFSQFNKEFFAVGELF